MAISKQAIFDAADALDAGGQRPTLAALRKAVGGGSFTTISEAMKEWWAFRAVREAPVREQAPPVVGERLGVVADEIWALALQVANERLASEREAFDAARAQAEQDKQEAVELADVVAQNSRYYRGRFPSSKAASARHDRRRRRSGSNWRQVASGRRQPRRVQRKSESAPTT